MGEWKPDVRFPAISMLTRLVSPAGLLVRAAARLLRPLANPAVASHSSAMKEGYEPVAQEVLSTDIEAAAQSKLYKRRKARVCGLVSGILLSAVLLAALHTTYLVPDGHHHHHHSMKQKLGAGMLFTSGDQVLLLKRSSRHNDLTWGLPGGNFDPQDADLQSTAQREAFEELGGMPTHIITASLLTRRGKHNQKEYTVYIASVTAEEQAAFTPQLNHEHSEYKWWDVAALVNADTQPALHPVVDLLLQEPLSKQLAAHLPKWADAEQVSPAAEGAADLDRHREKIEKLGAGLLLVHDEDVLLLKRNSSHNNATWDIPGGNTELGDQHLFAAAKRECEEEMGPLPDWIKQDNIAGEILTKRGKHNEKHFTVYIIEADKEFRKGFEPKLSTESLAWKWFETEDVEELEHKHPRLEMLFGGKYKRELERILDDLDD